MILLPQSYLDFISEFTWPEINNLPLLVNEELDEEFSEESVQYWQEYVAEEFPNFKEKIIPIRVIDDLVLCFIEGKDDKLFELDLDNIESGLFDLDVSFKDYSKKHRRHQFKVKQQLDYLEKNVFTGENSFLYDRKKAKKSKEELDKLKKSKKKMIVTRSCVHDRVVALLSYRIDKKQLEISVITFLASDHPDYEKWNGLKAGLSLLFSEAHSIGMPPNLRFTSDLFNGGLPEEISIALEAFNLNEVSKEKETGSFKNPLLSANIVIDLLIRLENLSESLLDKIEKDKYLTKSGICYLLINHLWSSFSIEYILTKIENCHKLLFGKIHIEENPLEYFDFLNHGKSLLLIESFIEKLLFDKSAAKSDGHNGNSYEFHFTDIGIAFSLKKEVNILWGLMNQIKGEEKSFALINFEIIPIVRPILPFEIEHIKGTIDSRSEKEAMEKTLILFSASHLDWFKELYTEDRIQFDKLIRFAESKNTELIVCPYKLLELENMVVIKLNRINGVKI